MFKKKIILIIFLLFFLRLPSCYGFNDNLEIYSEAAILVDSNNKIIYEKNSNKKMYPASTTKILTAIIALEKCELDETIIASYDAIHSLPNGYSNASILEGEELTLEQLVTVFLVHSANEAGFILAEHISGSTQEFANLMNQKTIEIGCTNSHFTNPSGIHDENHYSTAEDLAKIAIYCMKNSTFRKIVSMKSCSIPATNKSEARFYKNTNELLNAGEYYYPTCIGIKTGYTSPAKDCLISCSRKNGTELYSVVLCGDKTPSGQNARFIDSINLYKYAYNSYSLNCITNKISSETSFGKILKNIIDIKNSFEKLNIDIERDI